MRHFPIVLFLVLAAFVSPALGAGGQVSLINPLVLSPASPGVNQSTTATYTVKNTGTASVNVQAFLVGARDPANGNADFPESSPVTLAPGQSYTYSASRSFAATGTYGAWPVYFDGTSWIELVTTHGSFTVQKLALTTPLALSPASPSAGQATIATFTVANKGGSAVSVPNFLVGARSPSNANADFPQSAAVTLQPGQSYTYSGARSFTPAGAYTAWPVYFDGTNWIELASHSSFSVAVSGGTGTLFPASSPWYKDISSASLDAESGQVISGLSARGGWGGGTMRVDFSIEVLRADSSVSPRAFTPTGDFYTPDCDLTSVPVPPGGRLEGEPNYSCASDGDCHLIVLQGTNLFEMWRANIAGGTSNGSPFNGGCLAVWNTTRDYWQPSANGYARGDQCTSADAGGYPVTALLFNADEVHAGAINHAIRFILPNDRIRKGQYVHPATHSGAGQGTPVSNLVPYGAQFRLKSTFNLQSLPNEGARAVARAMQRYGMFLSDGGTIALTAQSDTSTTAKWSGLLGAGDLTAIKVTDFDMVDGGARIPLTLDCTRTP